MDMKRAAYAAKKFFKFKTVIPCHYKTFPLLAQDAEELKKGLPGVDVVEPEVMKAIESAVIAAVNQPLQDLLNGLVDPILQDGVPTKCDPKAVAALA